MKQFSDQVCIAQPVWKTKLIGLRPVMLRRFWRSASFGVVALAASLVASGCTTSNYAAKVGSTYVTVAQLNSELNAIAANSIFVSKIASQEPVYGASKSSFNTRFVDQVLNRRIAVDLIESAIRKLGLGLTPMDLQIAKVTAIQSYGGAGAFGAFPASYQKQLVQDTAAITVLEAYLAKVNISASSLKSYYSQNIGQFTEICASHILVGTQAQAASIYSQIKGGASFSALAKADSGDSNTASNGGYIGCGTFANYASAFGPAFASNVLSATPNQVFGPVAEGTGFSVVVVSSKTALSFTQALPSVIAAEFGNTGASALNAFVSGLAKSATVGINPAYGSYSISQSTASVVPPLSPSA